MNHLSNLPFFEIEFTKLAEIYDPAAVDLLLDGIRDQNLTDLIVISHGWNNDMAEAKYLYDHIFEFVSEELKSANVHGKKFGILGIYWPSKKFAEEELIAGGQAAGLEVSPEVDYVQEQITELHGFFDDKQSDAHLMEIAQQIERSEYGDTDKNEVYEAIAALFRPILQRQETQQDEDAAVTLNTSNIQEVMISLEPEDDGPISLGGEGGAASIGGINSNEMGGGAAGSVFSFKGLLGGLRNVLNLATYYQMKERAGKIGSLGLNPLIRRVQTEKPEIKIHLIGHSFGARLVTSAIAGTSADKALQVQSLILLQAAFSHFSFAQNYEDQKDGSFRRIIDQGNIKGATVISHTRNDKAVGLAYAIASRVAKQVADALGDRNDFYGGLGSNGAQAAPGVKTYQLVAGTSYNFEASSIYNLQADTTIDGHSGIANKAVAEVIAAVIL